MTFLFICAIANFPLLEKVEQNEPQLLEKVESKNNTYLVIPFPKVYFKTSSIL
jgi:hypothetical protein